MSAPHTVKVNIPKKDASKQLSLQSCSAGRKLTISSNFLPLFGFEKGIGVVEEVIGENKGMVVRLANSMDKKKKWFMRERIKAGEITHLRRCWISEVKVSLTLLFPRILKTYWWFLVMER